VKRSQLDASDAVGVSWSIVMTDPKKDADKRRAEAQRARRLAATLSQPADQDRLKQYARELEGKAAKQDAPGQNLFDKEKQKR